MRSPTFLDFSSPLGRFAHLKGPVALLFLLSARLSWAATAAEAPVASAAPAVPSKYVEPPAFAAGAFYLEEDAFNLVRKSDRNYTGGGALSFSGDFVRVARLDRPISWIDRVLAKRVYDWIYANSVRVQRDYSFSFGVTVFTPEDLRHAAPMPHDRPYAALDFIHVSHLSYSDRIALFRWAPLGLAFSTDFTLGALGLQQGHELQAFIHHSIRTDKNEVCNPDNVGTESPPEPCGWPNQISAGGEPTAMYGAHLSQLLIEKELVPYVSFDATATGFAEIGYYTDVALGGEFRFGLIDSPFWTGTKSPLEYANMAGRAPHSTLPLHSELYIWGGARGRGVAYDALLEGQFRHSEVRVTAKPFLYEFQTGVTLNIWAFNLTYAPFVGRSSDFFGDPEGLHMWTSFFLSVHKAWD